MGGYFSGKNILMLLLFESNKTLTFRLQATRENDTGFIVLWIICFFLFEKMTSISLQKCFVDFVKKWVENRWEFNFEETVYLQFKCDWRNKLSNQIPTLQCCCRVLLKCLLIADEITCTWFVHVWELDLHHWEGWRPLSEPCPACQYLEQTACPGAPGSAGEKRVWGWRKQRNVKENIDVVDS